MTAAEAFAKIRAWAADIPGWQQDALRRLVIQESLAPGEIDELVAICKGESPAIPLDSAHLRNPDRDQGNVYLRTVHGVRHVNALAADQRLTLCKVGLTIIYGDNGSGKSGYARILKQACRARMPRVPRDDKGIIPDIYDPGSGTPGATIEYAINGQRHTCTWQLGQPADAALSAVSIFDSRTANVHVEGANDVAYTPAPLKVLGALAELCTSVKAKLAAEITEIQARTPQSIKSPACGRTTAVGVLMSRLAAETDIATVEKLATLTQTKQRRLAQLTSDLADDPNRAARQLSTLKDKVEGNIARLDGLFASILDDSVMDLRRFAETHSATQRAAEAASGALFSAEPIPQIGSDAWQALWASARAFSDQEAYADSRFPVTEPGSVCVLCQQELTPVAADRLNRFEAFVQDDIQQRAESARAAYAEQLAKFKRAAISIKELKTILDTVRDELQQATLASDIRQAVLRALWSHRQIRRCHADPGVAINTAVISYPRQPLVDQVAELATRANALVAKAGSPAHAALCAEQAELADRQWLNSIKADVLAEIRRQRQIDRLKSAQRDTTTHRITTKSREIAQALVTDALCTRFAQEVARFKIDGLAVELREHKSERGVPHFKVVLKRNPDAVVGTVLSEGEHRCVALAAFMAELATAQHKSGIVFDDPVSSLDHVNRAAVAKRLVDAAACRQVIVFTHDLAFLLELKRARDNADPKPLVASRSISRNKHKAGFCRQDSPLKTQKVSKITATLARRLGNERYHYGQGNQDEWRKTVKSIATELRDAWEIAVEEVVRHVIPRLSNKVKTSGLVKLTVVTDDDCTRMRDGFKWCSDLLHSDAAALNPPLPEPEELSSQIDALKKWAEGLRQRQKAAKLR